MKFPKLKHATLCQVLLYLPAFSFFFVLIVLSFLPESWQENDLVSFLGIFPPMVFSLWYLFYNLLFFLGTDGLFSDIRQWKIDREEYRTKHNGLGREIIQKKLLRRCARWGKKFETQKKDVRDVTVYYHQGYSWTVFRPSIENRVAICSTHYLTEEEYHILSGQARRALHRVHFGKVRFKPKSEQKGTRAEACVVIFLADWVDERVKALARKPLKQTDDICILPCVVQCSDGCYYTDCKAEHYMIGIMSRPARNYACALLRRLVFGGRFPKENRATQPAFDAEFSPEISLWEFIRMFRKLWKEADSQIEKDRAKAYRQLRSGETRIDKDGIVWYKQDIRLAEYAFLPSEEDEMLVTLADDSAWYYLKDDDFVLRLIFSRFGNDWHRKKMKREEKEQVRKCIENALMMEGYRIERDDCP